MFFFWISFVETVLLKLQNVIFEVEGAWRRRGASCRCNRHRFWVWTIYYLILEASDRVVEKFSASDEAWRFGTPNQKQIFWPKKRVTEKGDPTKALTPKKGSQQLDGDMTTLWHTSDLINKPSGNCLQNWLVYLSILGPPKMDPEAADAPSANNLQDCDWLVCESWTWRMPAIFKGRLFVMNIDVCFGSILQHFIFVLDVLVYQKMMNDVFFGCNAGLRTVLHFTGQSTMPETKFCSRDDGVAVGSTYHPTTSAHSYNTMASIFLLGRISCAYVANMCAHQNYHFVSSFSNKKCSGQSSCNASEMGWTLRVNLWRNCWKSRGIGGLMELFRFDTQVQQWHRSSENKTSWDSLLGLAHLCSIKTLMYPPQEWDGWHCPTLKNCIPASQKNHWSYVEAAISSSLVLDSWVSSDLLSKNNLSRQVASKSWRVNGGAKPIDFESQDVILWSISGPMSLPRIWIWQKLCQMRKGLQEVHTGVERWINFSVSFVSLEDGDFLQKYEEPVFPCFAMPCSSAHLNYYQPATLAQRQLFWTVPDWLVQYHGMARNASCQQSWH